VLRNIIIIWDHQLVHKLHTQLNISGVENSRRQKQVLTDDEEADRIYDETIEAWARALEPRDKEIEGHTQIVVSLTVTLAKKLGICGKEIADIRREE
jgi:HD-GYP domain-containing protein (c-di-GMP phosphodiesterase class II)